MIPMTRRTVKTIRSVFRAALDLSPQQPGPPLLVRSGSDGLSVSAATTTRGIRYHLDGSFPEQEFRLPFEFLKEAEGPRNDAVLLDPTAEDIRVQWVIDSVPQTRTYHVDDLSEALDCPAVDFASADARLLVALSEAAQTCSQESTRYALRCIQLRGAGGTVVATDSRQLLMESGFTFPWDDNALIPGSRVFAHRELQTAAEVGIGRAGDVVVLQCGAWTTWLAIETGQRFPEVDSVIPDITAAVASVHIPRTDGEFLRRSVRQLPSDDEQYAPVTVDLNGSVAVRAVGADSDVPTELVLSRSMRTGNCVRFCTDRRPLARAMQLGFDRLHVLGPDRPVVCEDGQRKFVWMLLGKEGVIAPSQQSTRIESAATSPEPSLPTSTTVRNPTPMNRTTPSDTTPANAPTQPDQSVSLIDRAESLRNSLHTALADVRNLITTLKQQQKTSRSVQSALKSLRQLEALEV